MASALTTRVARLLVVGTALLLTLLPARPGAAQTPTHPLDALTAKEYWTIYDVLKTSGRVDDKTRYAGINLQEPPKAEVLKWKPGDPIRREAFVIVKQGTRTVEAVVDVNRKSIISWNTVDDVQPNVTEDEDKAIEELVKQSPEWRQAMAKRGITDFEPVSCYGAVLGYFDTPDERGRRLARAFCSDRRGAWSGHGREVEGVVVLIDLEARKVLRVIDAGVVPVAPGSADYDETSVEPRRRIPTPLVVSQPQGPSFTVNGHEVSWQNWKFHFRIDARVGNVISQVRYADGAKERSVLYQASLSEIFVPYMDPSEAWYFVNFLDVSELSYGFADPLERGSDCPDYAVYFDAIVAGGNGIPKRRPRAACLFERHGGEIAWRHLAGSDEIESRKRRDLVLRMIATIGNYDYLVDWVFMQEGTIKVVGAATGMVNVKTVAPRNLTDDGNGNGNGGSNHDTARARESRPDGYGRFIAENRIAVNHDHFLSFRMDVDVDGPDNSFVMDRLVPQQLPASHPRRSIWVIDSTTARSEQDGKLHMNMERPALWRVINGNQRGPLGYPTSYHIKPGHTAMSLLADDDNPQVRAGFSKYALWVTRQSDQERFAVGRYPTGSKRTDGLPAWTRANRPIENTDIVVWYTMGMHHVARAEDWPVMPASWHEFELRPFDFFSRNPALDLPKEP